MKMKKDSLGIITFLMMFVLMAGFSPVADHNAKAASYYIDSKNGDDANDGKSIATAWKNLEKINSTTFVGGDSILFKRGGKWTGQLWPKGSGEPKNTIKIDTYGQGPLPLIAGMGKVKEVVKLFNQQYWDMNSLEITNHGQDPNSLKIGVYVGAENYGVVHHLQFRNLYIHNVNGTLKTKHNGGIYLEILGKERETWFDDVLIEGCHVCDVDRTGISNTSTWQRRTVDDNMEWVPSRNFVVRNTVVEGAGLNGIIPRCTDGALFEYCTFKNNGVHGTGNAIFVYNTDNSVIQYCEAYGTFYNEGDHDAGGFDSDCENKNVKIQYNYSHDNGLAGVVLAVGDGPNPFNINTHVRYNILQNNARQAFRLSGMPSHAKIYNNVIYIGSQLSDVQIIYHKKWRGLPSDILYANNIFYNLSENARYDLAKCKNIEFSHNVFFGNHPASEPNDQCKITNDPKLVNPGSGGLGRDSVDGYKLLPDSPCIDSGMIIEDNGGKDYWGNPLYNGKPDRGVYERW